MTGVAFSVARWAAALTLIAGLAAACGSDPGAEEGVDGGAPDAAIAFGDATFDNPNACKPQTCAAQGIECGPAGDGCGALIDNCGTCGPGTRCGGPGASSKCVDPKIDGGLCTPQTCQSQGVECGPAGDGCGGVLQCGSCGAGQQCGSDTAFSKCVNAGPVGPDGGLCVPKTCGDYVALGMDCGQQGDGCGGVLNCGTCAAPAYCGGGGASKCGGGAADGGVCQPKTCNDFLAQGIDCGPQPDGCGGMTASCGTCASPKTCGGGGTASKCGGGSVVGSDGGACVPTTCQAQGKNCGNIADGCGNVLNCGPTTCLTGQVCGGAGNANVCAVPMCVKATTCPTGMNCGSVGDGCGGTISCGGACTGGNICGGGGQPNVCGGAISCVAKTCADYVALGMNCGPQSNGCGGTLNCGTCTAPAYCGGNGPSKCGGGGTDAGVCVPKTCAAFPGLCGQQPDGCGGVTAVCATCTFPQTCGGGGVASKCGGGVVLADGGGSCVLATCGAKNCGTIADGCGNVITCGSGTCGSGQVCIANTCGAAPCTPITSCPVGMNCGSVANGCGGTVSCGSACTSPAICGGGGQPNVCGGGVVVADGGGTCTPRTCAQLGKNCGQVADGCGGLTPACGTCTSPDICGGGTGPNTANVCGGGVACTPFTCAGLNKNCGYIADGCGGALNCGTCTGVGVCGGSADGGGSPNVCSSGGVGGACTGLCLQQVQCDAGTSTTVTGVVYAPNGTLPIYDAVVYVPNGTVSAFGTTVTCDQCVAPSGSPLVTTKTNYKGEFTLTNMPAGTNIPLVIQVGKWRRQITITNVPACQTTAVAAATTRLPARKSEGDLPRFAVTTGGADALQCLLRKIGIHDTEFTQPSGNGRVHIYKGFDGTNQFVSGFNGLTGGARDMVDETTLFENLDTLMGYDALILTCEGIGDRTTAFSAYRQNMKDYADVGGRVFGSHFHHDWLKDGPAPLPATATHNHQVDLASPVTATIDTSFSKGAAMADWLVYVNGAGASPRGQISIVGAQHTIDAVNAAVATQWISIAAPIATSNGGTTNNPSVQYFTVNTPVPTVAVPAPNQCGRFVISDLHVSRDDVNNDFPSGCTSVGMTDQERLLAFMLFDLTACVQPDLPPATCATKTCAQQGLQCGLAGNGCGGQIDCGPCTTGTCGGGGVASQCGGPSCVKKTCAEQGATCGTVPDGCGGTVVCPPCTVPGETCGGGGVAYSCGKPTCPALTCAAQGIECGPAGNGCGGTIASCGTCPNGESCGGGPRGPGKCDAPTCNPLTVCPSGMNCGSYPDGCGGSIGCGVCPSGQTCGGGGAANKCGAASCAAKTCASLVATCGFASDGCGNILDCGNTCANNKVCQNNTCVTPACTATSCVAAGVQCGPIGDGCGNLLQCGTCPSGQTCGGGGQPGICGAPSCTKISCAAQGISCGPAGDGCGGTQQCGTCPSGQTCGGGGQGGKCGAPGCNALTQCPSGMNCGSYPDGCGGVLNCGACPNGQACGGGGSANVCGAASCSASTCISVNATCGPISDGCGNIVDCGQPCAAGQLCSNNQCVTPACTPTTCAAAGVACGPLADGCGGLLQCGSCANGQSCGGGGVPGQCGGPSCTPRSCASLNASCGQVADGCGGLTPVCGTCAVNQTCSNGTCLTACVPKTCAEANANCGRVADGCGGLTPDCGGCVPGQTCGGAGVANQCGGTIIR